MATAGRPGGRHAVATAIALRKSLRVFHIISGLDEGGAEAVLFRLCTASPDRASDVVVSLTTEDAYGDRLRAAGFRVHALHMRRGMATLAGVAELFRIVRETQPDLVQTWLYHGDFVGGITARLAGVRRVVWNLRNSTVDPRATPRSTQWILRGCALASSSVPARIISCSRAAAAVHVALGYPAERITVVPNGYDLEEFRPDAAARAAFRREIGASEGEPLLGMVARYSPQKDPLNLLDALAILARGGVQFHAALVGVNMDADNSELSAAIAERGLGGRISTLGSRRAVPVVMAGIDIAVLSSAYGEAFPNVVAEAMACGTPVVATDVGDSSLIVGNTGWIVPPRDPAALANALGEALTEQADLARWTARQARCRQRIVDTYGMDRMVAGYEAVWRQVLAQG